MNNRQKQIGFSSQLLRLEYMRYVGNLVASGSSINEVRDELSRYLLERLSGGNRSNRGSRQKLTTILINTWAKVQQQRKYFHRDGILLFGMLESNQQIAVHWGLITAAYPFWAAVAQVTGRLLRLQGYVTSIQVSRRVKEAYGDREIVSRATRTVLRSYVDWEVLAEAKEKGVYNQRRIYSIDDPKLISWLIEASLHARSNGSAGIKDLLDSTSLFPFRLVHVSAKQLVSMSPRLDLLRHGLDDDLVMLREEVLNPTKV